ncbi:A/G-specific adenine glycosylase [Isosphaeraceae bacterium EP7]
MARRGKDKGDEGAAGSPADPKGDLMPDLDAAWVDRIRARLLEWYAGAARDLPWRADRDAYRILVSETMLVQTTVAAVVPFFHRFLERFPSVEALAGADEADVLKAWEGLGYYRRARQLQAAARAIVRDHGGRVPDDAEAIRALPGVGRYIAGAVLSFAYDRPAPIVEANTQRVLARWLSWPEPLASTKSQARLWLAAGRLVPEVDAGRFNQAFMELGAILCTPRAPMCLVCPVAADCLARLQGKQDSIPLAVPKAKPLDVEEACALVVRQGRLLVVRRSAGGLWQGFWEFPTVHRSGADPAGRIPVSEGDLAGGIPRLTGVEVSIGPKVHSLSYGVTKHKVRLTAYAAVGRSETTTPGPNLDRAEWADLAILEGLPLSGSARKLAAWVAARGLGSLGFDAD